MIAIKRTHIFWILYKKEQGHSRKTQLRSLPHPCGWKGIFMTWKSSNSNTPTWLSQPVCAAFLIKKASLLWRKEANDFSIQKIFHLPAQRFNWFYSLKRSLLTCGSSSGAPSHPAVMAVCSVVPAYSRGKPAPDFHRLPSTLGNVFLFIGLVYRRCPGLSILFGDTFQKNCTSPKKSV